MEKIKFAVIGDCHYSTKGNYGTRNCLEAKKQLKKIIDKTNKEKLDFVLSLGDLGNGDSLTEIPEMLTIFDNSTNPVKYVIGNHDLVLRTAEEVAELEGIPSPFYDFDINNYKFIVLNAFEQSRYSPEASKERIFYDNFIKDNPWLKVQPWPGLMTEQSWKKLELLLEEALLNNQNVVLFSHVPTNEFGGNNPARIPEYQKMLDLLDKYPNVRAYIAGHCHQGGISVRNGVLHKTVRSVCDNNEPTAVFFEADTEKITINKLGNEENFIHAFNICESEISGTAPKNCIIMTNCGNITQADENGKFILKVPCPGMYCLKAVMDGYDDLHIPWIQAPIGNINIELTPNSKKKLYTGTTDGYHVLNIKDGNKFVKWFDISGKEYGSFTPDDKTLWYDYCNNYWTNGTYAFTAENEVSIRVLPLHKNLRNIGWFKGDLHAHLIHGENFYIGNIQQATFIAKAEGYDWLYIASEYKNDGYPTDVHSMIKKLSGDDCLYRLNTEFPKSRSNHFGNCNVKPINESIDSSKISSLELAEKYVWSKGGVTVPVHPFYDHMAFRELCLWILCAPEKIPCIDFFYNDDFPKNMAENYWFMLLNRGYEIGCFATSDAAFDVGRTPGNNRGATYLYMDSLTEENIKKAIMKRRTMVSWDYAAMIFSIGNYISGDKIPADGTEYILSIKVLWQKDRKGTLRIVRNGTDIKQKSVVFSEDEQEVEFEMIVSETENSWYLAILESDDGKIRSVVSPIFFRNNKFAAPDTIDFKRPFPKELLAYCEELTPEQLACPELIDEFSDKLKKYTL